jgi:D-glycero-D-manno-heptose 1,7-bisphosphate phosphatase
VTKPSYVVLDRDGTIIVERNYLTNVDDVELIPGAASGLRKLNALGLKLLVVTNQSAVGRGLLDLDGLAAIHRRMEGLLAEEGVHLAGIYYCPHLPEDNCRCRKPLPGLLESAAADFGFEPKESFVIGDKPCDVELGRRIAATTFLVRTGYGEQFAYTEGCVADYVVADLVEAANTIECLIQKRTDKETV